MSVAGIAGLFIGSPDPARTRDWYCRHLGIRFAENEGARFVWREADTGTRAETRFDFVDEIPRPQASAVLSALVRYRVRGLDALVEALREGGDEATVLDERRGRVIDPDGRTVELLEAGTSPGRPADPEHPADDGRVRGIGGVFLRSPDPAALKAWYARLGIRPGPDGYVTFPATSLAGEETVTVWEVFPSNTTYFDSGGEASPHGFMLNLRVQDLDGLVESLRADGVWVDPKTETYEYGKFAWIVDPRGARVELWEPASAAG